MMKLRLRKFKTTQVYTATHLGATLYAMGDGQSPVHMTSDDVPVNSRVMGKASFRSEQLVTKGNEHFM